MFQPNDAEIAAFLRYFSMERNCSPKTAEEYSRDVERFRRSIEPKPLRKAKVKHVRRFINGLLEDGSNQPQSVHRKIAALKAFYKWQIREGRRNDNPVDAIEKPKVGKRLPKCMTEDEIRALLVAAASADEDPFYAARNRALLETMYGSGLRRAEAVGLSLGDVDFETRVARIIGKGNKERVVFLSQDSIDTMRAWLEVRPAGGEAIFVTKGGRRISARQLWVIFRKIAKASGITKHVVPHTVRHSFATHMFENGADIMTVKELLGHESISTTQIYTNVSMTHMRATFDRTHPRAKNLSATTHGTQME